MNLKQYLFIMFFATVLCWVSWIFVIVNIDPFQSNFFGFLFFYLSLFFSLLGSFSLVFLLLRKKFSKDQSPFFVYVQNSFAVSVIVSFAVIVLLYLYSKNLLTLLNSGLLVIIVLLLFVFFVSFKRK